MSYIDKFVELFEKGYTLQEITENIYINYNSYYDVDLVYTLRKEIATRYQCDINSVKLIGSAHTGFGVETNRLYDKEPYDFDFAIIDPYVFIRFYHKINIKYINGENISRFTFNFLHGKLHTMYQDKESRKEIDKVNNEICDKLNLKKKISICFYLSERCYISFLCNFFDEVYMAYLKEKRGRLKPLAIYPIKEVKDFK